MGWTININEIDETVIDAFSNSDRPIEIGDTGIDVQMLEQLLEDIDPKFYNGPADDEFGKGVRKAVLRFQQARLLEETGAVDVETRRTLVEAWRDSWRPGMVFALKIGAVSIHTFGPNHPALGDLPETALGRVEGGRISNFGGPHDAGDRIYGQAYLAGAKTPRAFIQKHKALVRMGVVMTEAKALAVEARDRRGAPLGDPFFNRGLDEWPLTTDWRGRERRAGPSSLLNPDGCYCAIRWRRGQRGRSWRDENSPRIIVYNPETCKAAITLGTDYGPHPDTGKYVDVASKVERHLGLKTGGFAYVAYGLDGAAPALIG